MKIVNDTYKEVNGIKVLTSKNDSLSADDIKMTCDNIKDKMQGEAVVIVIASTLDDKITFVASASKEAIAKGVHAGKIIKAVTQLTGGNGGGKPDMAQGGGKDASKIDDALLEVENILKEI